jgi:hypothetical protein
MELRVAHLAHRAIPTTASRGARLVPCVPGGVTTSSERLRAFLTVAESAHHNSLEMRLVPDGDSVAPSQNDQTDAQNATLRSRFSTATSPASHSNAKDH